MLKAHWVPLCALPILSACTHYAWEKSVYYVSASGDDTNDGLTAANPWKTLNKVSTHNFQQGEQILFRGGDIFSGLLYFNSSSDSASRQNPITVSSYGGRKATIDAGSGDGIFVYNIGGVEIRNINIIGSGSGSNNGRGIIVYNDLPNTTLEHIVIDNVDVRGFSGTPVNGAIPPSGNGWGIIIAPGSATSKYQYVTITNTVSHDNVLGGVFTAQWDPTNGNLISDVYVGNVQAYNNTGIPGLNNNHSGNGITLGGVTRGIIEYSKAYNNGALNTYSIGPCGLWTYLSDQVTIQFNEAYSNKTGSSADGCGFDVDGGTTNSVVQYNYSHDNDGAGFLVNWYTGVSPTQNNIVRYNITENDGRKATGTQSPITLHADNAANLIGTNIYNNTIYNNLGASQSRESMYQQEPWTRQFATISSRRRAKKRYWKWLLGSREWSSRITIIGQTAACSRSNTMA